MANGPARQVEYRRAHRRVLPEGKKPSSGQIIKAWDEYGSIFQDTTDNGKNEEKINLLLGYLK